MFSEFDVLGYRQNIPIFMHVLDVFPGQGDPTKMSNYLDAIPPLRGRGKKYFGEKNTFPMDLIL